MYNHISTYFRALGLDHMLFVAIKLTQLSGAGITSLAPKGHCLNYYLIVTQKLGFESGYGSEL